MYLYMYICICIHRCIYIDIYIYTPCFRFLTPPLALLQPRKPGLGAANARLMASGGALNEFYPSVGSVMCVSPVPTGWVSRSHGDTTRGDGRHTDHRSNDNGVSVYSCGRELELTPAVA